MTQIEEIEKAIGAHGNWKVELKQAIATGQIDRPVETIGMDNQCYFGKWLEGSALTSTEKASHHYATVKDLHAEFHRVAAYVVELALKGKKHNAEKIMALGGEYSKASSNLTLAMIEWKRSLG